MQRIRAGLTSTLVALACVALAPGEARAGGFELPDNGTRALGRGGAFVAKADDPTAIQYNPAGLARQRGTRLLVNANIDFHSFQFHRAGVFPDDPNDPATPWGGKAFPVVTNVGGPFAAPFLAATSDFGTFDRLTFGLALYGPASIGNRTFPLGVGGAPAASRYDFVQSRSTIVYPTASAAYRITPWLDFGVSVHLVLGSFDQTTVSYADLGQCPNPEYEPCDSRSTLTAKGTSVAGTFGVMVRPSESVAFGASVRTPISINAQGTLTPKPPKNLPVEIAPGAATLSLKLPWVARLGARYVKMDRDFEVYDLELDGTYEAWASAQGDGPRVTIPQLGTFKDIDTLILHHYKDTFSVRAGGAYHFEALSGVLTTRAGGYFDSPATDFAYTRLDFDTLAKIAGTIGLGYRKGAFSIDLAYAAVASIPRVVGTDIGVVRPVNGAKNGRPIDNNGDLLPAVNEGAYRGFTHILSLGATVTFDVLFGGMREVHYGNPWEPGYVPEAPGKAEDEKKEDEDEKKEEADDDSGSGSDEDAKPGDDDAGDDDEGSGKKKEWWEQLD